METLEREIAKREVSQSHRELVQRCQDTSQGDLVQRSCQETFNGDLVGRPGEEDRDLAQGSFAYRELERRSCFEISYADPLWRSLIDTLYR